MAERKQKRILLRDLLDALDYNREDFGVQVQIVRPGGNWDEFDEVGTGSALLIPLYMAEITEMDVQEGRKLRIDIDWQKLNDNPAKIFDWGESR